MLATRQPVLRRYWYPVIPLANLADGPKPATLLGEDLVLWLDAAGQPAAAEDRCCHRTAKLSAGFVDRGTITCAYHGWAYDRDGWCVRIPQAAEPDRRRAMRVESYRCQALYDYAWVCLDEPLAAPPELPEFADPAYRVVHQFYEPWHTSGLRIMENSFDNAHFSLVHAATFGKAEEPVPASSRIEEFDGGFHFLTRVPIKLHPLQNRALRIEGTETVRDVHSTFFMPFMRKFKVTYPSGIVHCIVTSATPIDDQHSMICQFAVRNDTEADAPAAEVNAFDRLVMTEDRAVLETTDPDVPLTNSRPIEYSMAADKPGLLIRRKFRDLLAAHGEADERRRGPVRLTRDDPRPERASLEVATDA